MKMLSKSLPLPPEVCTLCIVRQDGRILLGRKKRGFGVGYWNGFGGHVEVNETIENAAARELYEEAGLTTSALVKRGLLEFTFADSSPQLEVHVYIAREFSGTPHETDEMAPRWFPLDQIPYEQMWSDDPHWLPFLLAEKHFHGRFHFLNTRTLLRHDVKELVAAP